MRLNWSSSDHKVATVSLSRTLACIIGSHHCQNLNAKSKPSSDVECGGKVGIENVKFSGSVCVKFSGSVCFTPND